MTPRVLITGGCGFIGGALVRLLMGQGASVLNVDKLSYAANFEALSEWEGNPRYRHLKLDICDDGGLDAAFAGFRPDAVCHLAAESHVDRSIDGPAPFLQTNVLGTFTLLEATRRYRDRASAELGDRFRFLHISTDEVFGALAREDPPFTEDTPHRPNSPYSASKASADHLVRAWFHTYGLPTLTVNCSNNYGPWQFPEKLIPLMICKLVDREPLPVYGAGANVRDWLYVNDHARALALVLEKGAIGETYAVGGNAERRNIDLVHLLCRMMDERAPANAPHDARINFVADRPGHDLRYAVDASKIGRDLGWSPSVTFEQGLARTLDWYLANEAWWRAILETRYDGARVGLAAGQGAAP